MSHRDFSGRLYAECGMTVSLKFSDLDLVSTKCWFPAQLDSKMVPVPQDSDVQRRLGDHFLDFFPRCFLAKALSFFWLGHMPGMWNYHVCCRGVPTIFGAGNSNPLPQSHVV